MNSTTLSQSIKRQGQKVENLREQHARANGLDKIEALGEELYRATERLEQLHSMYDSAIVRESALLS